MAPITTPKKFTKPRGSANSRADAKLASPGHTFGDASLRVRSAPSDVGYLSSVRERTSMSTKTTKFLTDWLRWHVVGRVASAEDIPLLATKCLQDARRDGITRVDIEDAVGPIDECIRQALMQGKR